MKIIFCVQLDLKHKKTFKNCPQGSHKVKPGASSFAPSSQQQHPHQQQAPHHTTPSKHEHSEKFICHLCDRGFHLRWMLDRHQVAVLSVSISGRKVFGGNVNP
jgi:hypothetical protein